MKKIACVLLVLLFSVGAGAAERPYRNAVSIGVSDNLIMGTVFGVASAFGAAFDALADSTVTEFDFLPLFSLKYEYKPGRRRLGVGAEVLYSPFITNKYDKYGEPSDKCVDNIVMLLADFKWVYFSKGVVELYGNLGAGVCSIDFEDFAPSFQVNPLGISLGNGHCSGFIEGGFGLKGFVSAGFEYSF